MTIPQGAAVRKILLFEGTDAFGRLQTMLGPVDADPDTDAAGHPDLQGSDHRNADGRHHGGLGVLQQHGGRPPDAHAPGGLPGHRPPDLHRTLLTPKVNLGRLQRRHPDPASIAKTGTAPSVPGAWEAGKKDTVKLFPGEVTRVLVSFNRAGEYVYHCHILSHEDHEMMRPYEVA
ncbi:MAG: multicopper oxidase domain-containing protein [Comamonadaceae bacterium]|nr:multicopper oxidase domain-containing protein [Comamonadaceae bacterium]